ncbi:pyruvate kinase [Kribbella sp. NBC_01245]|uniref:pyruvate kinase n=1 Tax=Kribbella sp. NBC_01245 TaxID=2903578 RepID=UPI002E287867|nr:pyruvate kinase [Kribbella sp. NBC_01245]
MRRAKIVCTLGPATAAPERVLELVQAGMDVARLNLSHGAHAEHERIYHRIRAAAEETGKSVGILVDLQGPKIRLAEFAEGKVTLTYGERFTITTREVPGDVTICGTTYEGLPGDVNPGDPLLIDDGRVALVAEEVTETDVICRVTVGGPISNHKGINLPGVAVSVPAMSEKDIEDLRWALHLPADMIALSFVRDGSDIQLVHKIMDEEGLRLPVIAKIEKPQAVANLDEIIEAFDGFMVARGDLGVELPLEDVPLVQKLIIDQARLNAKPVIVATQMLESMISAPRPTRAEASDVANAVLDGADAVMLSGETSVGRYPIETVKTMSRIVASTEKHGLGRVAEIDWEPRTKGGVIAKAAADVADAMEAKYLVAFTQSGDTALRLARYRTEIPVLAFTPVPEVRNWLSVVWGIESFVVPMVNHTDDMVRQVDHRLLEVGKCQPGDLVVVVAGSPPGIPGSTNALRIHRMGDAVAGLAPGYRD